MTSMNAESVILRTDRQGRVRTPLAQREALLDAFECSGLSGMKFAALHGVKYPSFANWVQQRKRRRSMTAASTGPESGAGEVMTLSRLVPGWDRPLRGAGAIIGQVCSRSPPLRDLGGWVVRGAQGEAGG